MAGLLPSLHFSLTVHSNVPSVCTKQLLPQRGRSEQLDGGIVGLVHSLCFHLSPIHIMGSLANLWEDVFSSFAALITSCGNFIGAEAHYRFRSVQSSNAGRVLAHTAMSGTAYTLVSVI